MFGAFLLSRPAVIGTRPLSLSADVLYSWRNPYLLFGCRPKREPLILLGKTRFLYSAALFGMSSMIEIEQASAHSGKVTIPLDMSHPPANFQDSVNCCLQIHFHRWRREAQFHRRKNHHPEGWWSAPVRGILLVSTQKGIRHELKRRK